MTTNRWVLINVLGWFLGLMALGVVSVLVQEATESFWLSGVEVPDYETISKVTETVTGEKGKKEKNEND